MSLLDDIYFLQVHHNILHDTSLAVADFAVVCQQELAASHLAEEQKRQWYEAMQEAAAARARSKG